MRYYQRLRNGTCILLKLKVPKHSTRSETRHYKTEAIKSVAATKEYETSLTKTKKTLKSY